MKNTMTNASQNTRDILYNKKALSRDTNIRHYTTLGGPEPVYCDGTLKLIWKGEINKIMNIERLDRSSLDPSNTETGNNRGRSNKKYSEHIET